MSLDHLTNGRFELGVGVGWSWEEYAALGVPFERRGRRMDEYLDAMKLVWTEDRASFSGEFLQFEDLVLNPKPLTPGGPPIIIGGDSAVAMRRAARVGDGWYGWWAHGELEPHLGQLHGILADHNRSATDPDFSLKLGLPIGGDPEKTAAKIETARTLGVDELVLAPLLPTATFEEGLATYAELAGIGS